MKFPEEPVSMSASAKTEWERVTIMTGVRDNGDIIGGIWIVLTAGRGGRTGHCKRRCPSEPQ